jgi:hypothetical protein
VPTPNFFILGAPKCATTALYDALLLHPQVCMSEQKEPRFFELKYQGSVAPYETGAFPAFAGQIAVGEASPMYLMLPYVPARLARHYPSARLVAVLREPFARARSAWWMQYSAGREELRFDEAMRENLDRRTVLPSLDGAEGEYLWRRSVDAIERQGVMLLRTYVDSSLYGEALGRYLELFPRDQLLVLFFEDLVRDPASELSRLLDFLGVGPSEAVRFPMSNAALDGRWAPLVRSVSPLVRSGVVPRWMIEAGKQMLRRRGSPVAARLAPELHEQLAELFRADRAHLQEAFPDLVIPPAWEAGEAR